MRLFSIGSGVAALVGALAVFSTSAAAAPAALSPAAELAQAVAKMSTVPSYHANLRSTMKVGAQTITMSGGMDMDVRKNELSSTLDMGLGGGKKATMQMVYSHNTFYLGTDFFVALAGSRPTGLKPWLAINLKQLTGLDLDSLTQIAPSSYAGLWAQIGKGALQSRHDGAATVFSFRVSMSRLVEVYRSNPKLLAAIGGEKTLKAISSIKTGNTAYELRTEGGYLTGMAMTMRYTDPTSGATATTAMTYSLSDYGKPVTIDLPPASDTMTFAQLQRLGR